MAKQVMQRVMMIGSPGTGKSRFAQQLATSTGLPLIHLDFYYHDKNKNYYTDKEAWRKRVDELTAQNAWIIDGNYGRTMADRMQRADTIFYFDMPRRTALWGVCKRRFAALYTKRTDMPSDWKETSSWSFMAYVWSFKKQYAADTQELLRRNSDKQIVVFRKYKDVDAYLQNLERTIDI